MLLDGIISYLESKTAITSLVTGGIYRSVLPRGYVLPAVCVHRYGGAQEFDYSGPQGVLESQIQFDCYAATADIAEQISAAIKLLFVGSKTVPATPYTGTLPDGAAQKGTTYRIKLGTAAAGGSVLTVSPNNSKTIDGAATLTMSTLGQAIDAVYDGASNWDIF